MEVVGVVSLAIELTGKLQKLCRFVEAAKATPDTTKSILTRIRGISLVLEKIQEDANEDTDLVLEETLRACHSNIEKIERLTSSWIEGFAVGNGVLRALHEAKAARQFHKVEKLEELLDRTELTLIIAQNSQARCVCHTRLADHTNLTGAARLLTIKLSRSKT